MPDVAGLSLRTGDRLPAVGLGLWKLPRAAVAQHVQTAIDAGYRHFDCACDYGNEAEVGEGLQAALQTGRCRRDQLWITSKLWNTYHAHDHVRLAAERSLCDLRLDVLDLYLIHFPIATAFVPFETRYPPGWFFNPDTVAPEMQPVSVPIAETWAAMEDLVRAGLVRNIGVCNFNIALLRDVLSYAAIPPAVLQVELHPYLAQPKLLRFCREQSIMVTGFSPLGAASYLGIGMAKKDESVLAEPIVLELAARHERTPAQIVLRWGIQRGTAIVPMTSRPQRLIENLSLFDFELTADEMHSIDALDRHRRFNDPGVFCEAAFNTFFPIYE
jgi:D-xylose reductase